MAETHKQIEMIQVEQEKWSKQGVDIIVETTVSLTVNGENWLTFTCTPIDLEALAIGFLYNEGIIEAIDAVADVRICDSGDNIDIWLRKSVDRPSFWRRTSGCAGGYSAVSDNQEKKRVNGTNLLEDFRLSASQVGGLISTLFSSQDLYQRTGGVHTSVLSDGQNILLSAEDIGRHNTLDKLAGLCLLNSINPIQMIIITTGRISSDMVQKASRIGAQILVSRTSPSSLSIEIAERLGLTIIGYARRDRFRIYTHPERIILYDPTESEETKESGPTDRRNRRTAPQ